MEILRCRDKKEFFLHCRGEEFRRRHQVEIHLAQRYHQEDTFTVPGFCRICNKCADFFVDKQWGNKAADGVIIPNWRESLVCPHCQLKNRQRAIADALLTEIHRCKNCGDTPVVYLQEQNTPVYELLRKRIAGIKLFGSEYLGSDHAPGETYNGVRHENAQALSFPDSSIDILSSNEVLEHVPDPQAAMRECCRVLKSGGRFYLTIPFHTDRDLNEPRAEIVAGKIRHILPAEYHGNPLSDRGSLVFTDFGWQAFYQLSDSGFSESWACVYWSYEYGHLGGPQLYFEAVK
jgi:SAM-dependent methyltransferase